MRISWLLLAAPLAWMSINTCWAEGASKEQIKGLDEQVQEIKTDVLGITAELNRLEEKLIYPSNTEVSLFVSLASGDKFRLDAVDVSVDGKSVAHHIYTLKELEALQEGGVQRLYTGNIRTGEHPMQVSMIGKTEGGSEYRHSGSYTIKKGVGPKLVEIKLAGPGPNKASIDVKDW